METQLSLESSGNVVLNATGSGTITLFPASPWERWEITRYSTFSTGVGCDVDIYKNFVSDSNWVDGTLKGDADTGGIQTTLYPGEKLIINCTNGTTGDRVTVNLYGNRYVKGRRAY